VLRSSPWAGTVVTCTPISGLWRTRSRNTLSEIFEAATGSFIRTVAVPRLSHRAAVSTNNPKLEAGRGRQRRKRGIGMAKTAEPGTAARGNPTVAGTLSTAN